MFYIIVLGLARTKGRYTSVTIRVVAKFMAKLPIYVLIFDGTPETDRLYAHGITVENGLQDLTNCRLVTCTVTLNFYPYSLPLCGSLRTAA